MESQGQFTISRQEALRKLATFQLPFELAWVLKIVQAAVAGEVRELRIRQTSTDTEFLFQLPANWKLATLEQAFLQPDSSQPESIEHLRQGLWAASLNEGRPFQLVSGAEDDSVVWTGDELRRVSSEAWACSGVTVSHRKKSEGEGWFLLKQIQAARRNAEILQVLAGQAFTCPLPLIVDGRRLDGLQLCPKQGISASSHPLVMGWKSWGAEPQFRLPPGSFSGALEAAQQRIPSEVRGLSDSVTELAQPDERVNVAWMVTAHFGLEKLGKRKWWEIKRERSRFHWIRDGVVIQTEELRSSSPVSFAVFASADGLKLDLSGFALADDDDASALKRRALQAASSDLGKVPPISLEELIHRKRREAKFGAGGMMAAGALMSVVNPLFTLLLLGSGAAILATAGTQESALEQDLNRELGNLKSFWRGAS